MRSAFIEQHGGTFPVRLMCRVLEVSLSGFYALRSRPESAQAVGNWHLLAKGAGSKRIIMGDTAIPGCTPHCALSLAKASTKGAERRRDLTDHVSQR
jgi:hypothetical protein